MFPTGLVCEFTVCEDRVGDVGLPPVHECLQGSLLARAASSGSVTRPSTARWIGGGQHQVQVFDALDFIADLTRHIRDPRTHLVRSFGWYSNKSRGLRAKAAGNAVHEQQTTRSPSANAARRRWATLIKRVWEVDPLQGARCGAAMKIISFIEPTQPDVIQKILAHCGLADEPPAARLAAWVPRTPVRQ